MDIAASFRAVTIRLTDRGGAWNLNTEGIQKNQLTLCYMLSNVLVKFDDLNICYLRTSLLNLSWSNNHVGEHKERIIPLSEEAKDK